MVKPFLLSSRAGCVFVAATLITARFSFASQTLPFYETFPTTYTEGERLGGTTSGVVWDKGNGTGVGSGTNTIAAALNFSGLMNSNGSKGILLIGTPSSNRDRGMEFNPVQTINADNPTLYASFLLKIQLSPSGTRRLAYFRNSTSAGNNNAAVFLNSANQLQIAKSGTTPEAAATSPLGTGANLVVLRYRWVSAIAGDDEVGLWLNPGSLGVAEGSVPDPMISTTSGTDAADLRAFFISQMTDASGTLWLDEVRVATNWAGVTPTTGVVPPPSVPRITQTLMTLDGLVLRGTNGSPNGAYQVLVATNVTAQPFQWSAIATNFFDTNGNFDCTNPVSPADLQRFYRLLVGGQIPPPPVAPSITTQPTNVTVTVGQTATFSVVAAGDPTLFYQWYFNTNTLLFNATHFSLTITNVQTTNEGTYFVVVTNFAGSANSTNATLTVLPAPVAPSITSQPTNQTVTAGQPVTISVEADGTAPLRHQWFFNTNTALFNATNFSLTFASVHATNAGAYSVRVTNNAGSVTSTNAVLTVLAAPFIVTQPQNRTVTVSNDTTFTVQAVGTAPLHYQWLFNTNTLLSNETDFSLAITNAQTNDIGGYSVVITNIYGSTTSTVATLSVEASLPDSAFNLYGFGAGASGSGMVPETDPNYRKVHTPGDLRLALANNNTRVIEIMNDLNLGWNEIGASNQTGAFRTFPANQTPVLHPALIASGVTLIDVQNKNGLTIFSTNGATIRHAEFNLKRTHNVLIRNLKFDELWEWDEATKGDYDSKDWDFITIGDGGNCTNVWIDHCDFTKSYDGVVDIKGGDNNVTISWCRFLGDGGGPDSFVRQQFNHLETNGVAETMYDFLRANGFSVDDIVAIVRSQKKGHLVGATALDSDNAGLKLTIHHNYYFNFQDRIPRLRAGNAHACNIYANNTEALAAKRLRAGRAASMSTAARNTLNGTYKFDVTLNGAISTEDGAVLVEKCHFVDVLSPMRNNQTDPNDPAYTGKIRADDTIYTLDATTFRGSSEEPGSPLSPVPATIKPFSWNGFVSLPYSYPLDEPENLAAMLTGSAGPGAGAITWAKTNWLKTAYSP